MKTALYIEDGVTQIMLTTETEFEKGLVRQFADTPHAIATHRGTFAECRGGYSRLYREDEASLMLRITKAAPPPSLGDIIKPGDQWCDDAGVLRTVGNPGLHLSRDQIANRIVADILEIKGREPGDRIAVMSGDKDVHGYGPGPLSDLI